MLWSIDDLTRWNEGTQRATVAPYVGDVLKQKEAKTEIDHQVADLSTSLTAQFLRKTKEAPTRLMLCIQEGRALNFTQAPGMVSRRKQRKSIHRMCPMATAGRHKQARRTKRQRLRHV